MFINLSFRNGFTVSIKFFSFSVIGESIILTKRENSPSQEIFLEELVYYTVTPFPFWSNVIE